MAEPVRRHFELGLRLGPPNLAGSAVLPRLVLHLLGARQHLASASHRRLALRDARFDLLRANCQTIDPTERRRLALGKSFDEGPRFGRVACSTLVPSASSAGAISGFSALACGL